MKHQAYSTGVRHLLGMVLTAMLARPTDARVDGEPTPEKPSSPAATCIFQATRERLPPSMEAVVRRYAEALDVLPLEKLEEVSCSESDLLLTFDFGQKKRSDFKLPDEFVWVLEERKPVRVKISGRRFRVARTLRIHVQDGHVVGIGEGDMEVRWGPSWPDLEVRSEHAPGRPQEDEEGRPHVRIDQEGRPVRTDEGWALATYDDWLVFTCKGREQWIGVARASTTH